MIYDPVYLLIIVVTMVFSGWASLKTRSAFKKYSQVRVASGQTGAQAAQTLLDRAGISDVKIKAVRGMLSDHYNPVTKTLALSQPVYGQSTVAAVGVACHEAGHAIQHAEHYVPLKLRSALVPAVNFGNRTWIWLFMTVISPRITSGITVSPSKGILKRTTEVSPEDSLAARCAGVRVRQRRS